MTRRATGCAGVILDHRVAENHGDAVALEHALLGEPSPQSVKLAQARALRAELER